MAHKNEEGRNKPLYMISVAAELTGMHPQTLRVYEQKGLVNPGRSRGNTRLYSQADIERLELIGRLTDEGINLAGVVRILDMREHEEEMEREIDEMRARVRELEDQVREFKTRERITALAPYEGMTPEKVMRGLLGARWGGGGLRGGVAARLFGHMESQGGRPWLPAFLCAAKSAINGLRFCISFHVGGNIQPR